MCSVENCSGRYKAKGLCRKHYARLQRTGSAEDTRSCRPSDPKQRFELLGWDTDPGSGCWVWRGRLSKDGYGQFRLNGTQMNASRASYILFVGSVPEGHVVRHTCDNPSCVNPDHLVAGTVRDNVYDCISRNRRSQQGGDKSHNKKLSESVVAEIRNRYSSGTTSQQALAVEYGVSQVTISKAVRRSTW